MSKRLEAALKASREDANKCHKMYSSLAGQHKQLKRDYATVVGQRDKAETERNNYHAAYVKENLELKTDLKTWQGAFEAISIDLNCAATTVAVREAIQRVRANSYQRHPHDAAALKTAWEVLGFQGEPSIDGILTGIRALKSSNDALKSYQQQCQTDCPEHWRTGYRAGFTDGFNMGKSHGKL